jgi:O-antigen/teichoic acid export membrane protein
MGNSVAAPGPFIRNIVWNWAGVLLSVFSGVLLSPIFLRTLGPQLYGIWALSFSIVEYYWLFDLGLRAATVKSVAHYHTIGEKEKIAAVLSTSLAYAITVATLIFVLANTFVHLLASFFNVSAEFQETFILVLRLVTFSCCAGMVMNLFQVSLEAVQRFDLTGRIAIVVTAIRALGTAALLLLGYGLVEIALLTIASQATGFALSLAAFRQVFPGLPLGRRHVGRAMFFELFAYAKHSFAANTSVLLNQQTAPVLIGHHWPAAYVGFYTLPLRLISIAVDFVGRVGLVTNTKAAELAARGELATLSRLAIYTNRFCLLIFLPLAIFLWIYREPLFLLWVGAEVASVSAPLLPVIVAGHVLGVVGQFSSSMILMGMGRHQRYARGVAVETAVSFGLLWVVVPRFGIMGAAWAMMTPLVLNRGLYAAWLVSQETRQSFGVYLRSIYLRPLLAAAAVSVLAWLLRYYALPGAGWIQMIAAGCLISAVYYTAAFWWCLETEQQEKLRSWWSALHRRFAT